MPASALSSLLAGQTGSALRPAAMRAEPAQGVRPALRAALLLLALRAGVQPLVL